MNTDANTERKCRKKKNWEFVSIVSLCRVVRGTRLLVGGWPGIPVWEAFIGKVPRGFPVILTTTWAAIIQAMIQIQIIAALIQIQMQVHIQIISFGKGSMKKKTIVLCGWVSVENTIFNVTRRSRSDVCQ